jgi:hypothetical protein
MDDTAPDILEDQDSQKREELKAQLDKIVSKEERVSKLNDLFQEVSRIYEYRIERIIYWLYAVEHVDGHKLARADDVTPTRIYQRVKAFEEKYLNGRNGSDQ